MERMEKVSMYVILGCCFLGLILSALALKWTAFIWATALIGWMNYRESKTREAKLIESLQFDVDMMSMMMQEIEFLRSSREQGGNVFEGEARHENT